MSQQQYFPFTDLTNPPPEIAKKLAALHGHGKQNRNDNYDAQQPKSPNDRQRILQLLQSEPHFLSGLTRDEIAVMLEMQLATVCGRCRELLDHVRYTDGMTPIYETVLRRPTRTGSSAVVLCARIKTRIQT